MEMVHGITVAFAYDYWANNIDASVELNCLMPNGVYIPLCVNKNSTFNEIKEVRIITLKIITYRYSINILSYCSLIRIFFAGFMGGIFKISSLWNTTLLFDLSFCFH